MGTSDTSWSGSEGLFLRYNDAIVIDVVTFLRIIFFMSVFNEIVNLYIVY